jgi:hypothetical protein
MSDRLTNSDYFSHQHDFSAERKYLAGALQLRDMDRLSTIVAGQTLVPSSDVARPFERCLVLALFHVGLHAGVPESSFTQGRVLVCTRPLEG